MINNISNSNIYSADYVLVIEMETLYEIFKPPFTRFEVYIV